MRTALLVVLMAMAAMTSAAADFPDWMAGSWRIDTTDGVVEEHWTAAGGGVMLGMGKTVRANGRTTFEFLRIVEVDGKLVYLAMPKGRPPTAFPLRTAGA